VDEAVPNAIAALVAEHYSAVYRYAYRLCGGTAEAEDLTQQVFLNAQRKLDQLRGAEAARAWLFAILRNCFLAARRQSGQETPGTELCWDELPENAPVPSAIDSELLQQALDALPADYRLILLMFYFEDYSYREIAERLELPIGTVMSRLSRAKGALRSGLWGPKLKEMLASERT
jgi:RNA polymerase sigma-70 factor (ECF subfamily)